jgi:hypothetical protein
MRPRNATVEHPSHQVSPRASMTLPRLRRLDFTFQKHEWTVPLPLMNTARTTEPSRTLLLHLDEGRRACSKGTLL